MHHANDQKSDSTPLALDTRMRTMINTNLPTDERLPASLCVHACSFTDSSSATRTSLWTEEDAPRVPYEFS
jgi:hypothetical protein